MILSGGERPLSVEEKVAITLWRFGTNIKYRSIAHLFGVGLSTVCAVVHEVCMYNSEHPLVKVLYIRIPKVEDAKTVVDGFYILGAFRNVLGQLMVAISQS